MEMPAAIASQHQTVLDRPIFVSGLRKSGTSMVRQLLDGHPELFVAPQNEVHFFKFTHYRHSLMQFKSKSKPIAERIEDICNDRWFNPRQHPDPTWKPRNHINYEGLKASLRHQASTIKSYKDLFKAVLVGIAQANGGLEGQRDPQRIRVACKGVQQEEFLPELRSWFPDIRFVYVLRSPYAQLNSAINNMRHNKQGLRKKHGIGRDFNKLDRSLPYPYLGTRIKQMKLSYFFARKYAELYPENFRILVYDRLLADPEKEMQSLASFLEIDFLPCLISVTQGGEARDRAGWSVGRHEAGKISTKPLTAWKQQLPPLAVRLVNYYLKDEIAAFGFEYVPSNAPRWKRFDRSEQLKTYFKNRLLFTRTCRTLVPL